MGTAFPWSEFRDWLTKIYPNNVASIVLSWRGVHLDLLSFEFEVGGGQAWISHSCE